MDILAFISYEACMHSATYGRINRLHGNLWWALSAALRFWTWASCRRVLGKTLFAGAGRMWKLVLIGCGVCGAYLAGRVSIGKLKEQTVKTGTGSDASPMSILAKGVLCVQDHIGPWSAQDVVLGLSAIAKVTEKQILNPPGHPAPAELSKNAEFLMRAQHWRALAEAVYAKDPSAFSLFSHLPESSIVAADWNPDQETLRPAYALAVDPSFGALVLSVRGTSHIIDMLVSTGTLPVPFMDGHAHHGFARATEALLKEARPHIESYFNEESDVKKLVIVGHSMGAAIGIMCGLKLRDKFKDLECWGYSVPASLNLELAKECGSFSTCFVALHDVVPRFSIASIEDLRKRVCNFDWKKAEEVAKDDEDWQKIKKAVDTMEQFRKTQDGIGENVQKFQGQVCNAMSSGDGKKDECQRKDDDEGKDDEKGDEDENEQNELPTLHPPGKLLVLASDPPGCGKAPDQRSGVAEERNYGAFPTFEEAKNVKWVMHEAVQEDFSQIILSRWCVSDHMLGNLCEGINFFQKECPPVALVQ